MPTLISILLCWLSVLGCHGVSGQSMWDVLPGSGGGHATVSAHGHHSAPVRSHGFWGQIMKHEAETNNVPSQHSLSSSGNRKRRRKVIPASLRSLHTIATDYNDYGEEEYDEDEEIMNGNDSHVDNILRAQR